MPNFSGSLATMVNVSNHKKSISFNDQLCMARPTLIDFNPAEYYQQLCYYLFLVKLDRYNGSCKTLNGPSSKICVANKTEDTTLNVFNVITRINVLKE